MTTALARTDTIPASIPGRAKDGVESRGLSPPGDDLRWLLEKAPDSQAQLKSLANRLEATFEANGEKEEWLEEIALAVGFTGLIEERTALFRGTVLWVVKNNWDKIPLGAGKQYSFRDWASRVTMRDSKTIDNWIRTAEVFILMPPQDIPDDFVPEEVSHSRLVACARKVAEGEMTPRDWEALRDPHITHREFVQLIHDTKERTTSKGYYFRSMGHLILFIDAITGEPADFIEFDPLILKLPSSDNRYRAFVAVNEFLGSQ